MNSISGARRATTQVIPTPASSLVNSPADEHPTITRGAHAACSAASSAAWSWSGEAKTMSASGSAPPNFSRTDAPSSSPALRPEAWVCAIATSAMLSFESCGTGAVGNPSGVRKTSARR